MATNSKVRYQEVQARTLNLHDAIDYNGVKGLITKVEKKQFFKIEFTIDGKHTVELNKNQWVKANKFL